MAGRYGSKDIRTTQDTYQKSAKDVYVRSSRVDYSGATNGIIKALGNIKEYKDEKAQADGQIEVMGLHGVVTPGADNIKDKTFNHMEGQAFVNTYRKDYMAEAQKYQNLPDDQFQAKMREYQMKTFKGKSRDFVMGVVAGGGIDVDDAAVTARHAYQRKQRGDAWNSGAAQRAENAVIEEVDGATLRSNLDFELKEGTANYANPDDINKSYYSAAAGKMRESGSYDKLKDLAFTPGADGKRLIDGPLGATIRSDLEYTKKKRDAGKVNQAYLEVKEYKNASGAPDTKRIGEDLDKRMANDPDFTLNMRNQALSTILSDYQTGVAETKRVANEVNTKAVEGVYKLALTKDYKGAMDLLLTDQRIKPSVAIKIREALETDIGVDASDEAWEAIRKGDLSGASDLATNDPNIKPATAVALQDGIKAKQQDKAQQEAYGLILKGDYSGAQKVLLADPDIKPDEAVRIQNGLKTIQENELKRTKAQREEALDSKITEITLAAAEDPLYGMEDALVDMGDVKLNTDALGLLSRTLAITQGPAREKYKRLVDEINNRFGYKLVNGFNVPNQKAALAVRLELMDHIEKTQAKGEEVDLQGLLTGMDKEGHWLCDSIKDHSPSLIESILSKNAAMKLDKVVNDPTVATSKWKRTLNKYLDDGETGLNADSLLKYVHSQKGCEKLNDKQIQRMLSNPKFRDEVIADYTKASN